MSPRALICRTLERLAIRHGRCVGLWRRLARPDGRAWARYLRARGGVTAMGEDCVIQTNVVITDPGYLSLGDNVHLSGCTLFGHDGTINMLSQAYGVVLDKVGPIEIGDHVFIGHHAIVMPGVRIGDRVVVAAGAVVTCDIPSGTLAGGVPARPIGTVDGMVERLARQTRALPWYSLLLRRRPGDPPTNPAMERMRAEHFHAARPSGAFSGAGGHDA
jgi:acetyltransferase-like isoleucine patch superfamily enzyme